MLKLISFIFAGILASSAIQAQEFTIEDAKNWNPSENHVKPRCSAYCDYAMGIAEHSSQTEKFTLLWDQTFNDQRFVSVRIDRKKSWWNLGYFGRTYRAFYECDSNTIMRYEVKYYRN